MAKKIGKYKGFLLEMKRKKLEKKGKLTAVDGAYDLSPEGETMPSNKKRKEK